MNTPSHNTWRCRLENHAIDPGVPAVAGHVIEELSKHCKAQGGLVLFQVQTPAGRAIAVGEHARPIAPGVVAGPVSPDPAFHRAGARHKIKFRHPPQIEMPRAIQGEALRRAAAHARPPARTAAQLAVMPTVVVLGQALVEGVIRNQTG